MSVESLAERWDRAAAEWDGRQGAQGDALRRTTLYPWVLSRLPSAAGLLVLDVGCGNGSLGRVLSALGASVVGVDASEAMVAYARRRSEGGTCRLVALPADAVSDALGTFDAATALFVLQDLADPRRALARVGSALRPGGALVLVLESEETLRDLHGHQTTRRWWSPDAETDPYGFPSQSIDWGGGASTVTYVRPLGFYLEALATNGFEVEAHEILSPILVGDDEAAAIRDRVAGKFVGVSARRRG